MTLSKKFLQVIFSTFIFTTTINGTEIIDKNKILSKINETKNLLNSFKTSLTNSTSDLIVSEWIGKDKNETFSAFYKIEQITNIVFSNLNFFSINLENIYGYLTKINSVINEKILTNNEKTLTNKEIIGTYASCVNEQNVNGLFNAILDELISCQIIDLIGEKFNSPSEYNSTLFSKIKFAYQNGNDILKKLLGDVECSEFSYETENVGTLLNKIVNILKNSPSIIDSLDFTENNGILKLIGEVGDKDKDTFFAKINKLIKENDLGVIGSNNSTGNTTMMGILNGIYSKINNKLKEGITNDALKIKKNLNIIYNTCNNEAVKNLIGNLNQSNYERNKYTLMNLLNYIKFYIPNNSNNYKYDISEILNIFSDSLQNSIINIMEIIDENNSEKNFNNDYMILFEIGERIPNYPSIMCSLYDAIYCINAKSVNAAIGELNFIHSESSLLNEPHSLIGNLVNHMAPFYNDEKINTANVTNAKNILNKIWQIFKLNDSFFSHKENLILTYDNNQTHFEKYKSLLGTFSNQNQNTFFSITKDNIDSKLNFVKNLSLNFLIDESNLLINFGKQNKFIKETDANKFNSVIENLLKSQINLIDWIPSEYLMEIIINDYDIDKISKLYSNLNFELINYDIIDYISNSSFDYYYGINIIQDNLDDSKINEFIKNEENFASKNSKISLILLGMPLLYKMTGINNIDLLQKNSILSILEKNLSDNDKKRKAYFNVFDNQNLISYFFSTFDLIQKSAEYFTMKLNNNNVLFTDLLEMLSNKTAYKDENNISNWMNYFKSFYEKISESSFKIIGKKEETNEFYFNLNVTENYIISNFKNDINSGNYTIYSIIEKLKIANENKNLIDEKEIEKLGKRIEEVKNLISFVIKNYFPINLGEVNNSLVTIVKKLIESINLIGTFDIKNINNFEEKISKELKINSYLIGNENDYYGTKSVHGSINEILRNAITIHLLNFIGAESNGLGHNKSIIGKYNSLITSPNDEISEILQGISSVIEFKSNEIANNIIENSFNINDSNFYKIFQNLCEADKIVDFLVSEFENLKTNHESELKKINDENIDNSEKDIKINDEELNFEEKIYKLKYSKLNELKNILTEIEDILKITNN